MDGPSLFHRLTEHSSHSQSQTLAGTAALRDRELSADHAVVTPGRAALRARARRRRAGTVEGRRQPDASAGWV